MNCFGLFLHARGAMYVASDDISSRNHRDKRLWRRFHAWFASVMSSILKIHVSKHQACRLHMHMQGQDSRPDSHVRTPCAGVHHQAQTVLASTRGRICHITQLHANPMTNEAMPGVAGHCSNPLLSMKTCRSAMVSYQTTCRHSAGPPQHQKQDSGMQVSKISFI